MGPYSAVGSEGDPAAAAPYVRKALDLYSKLSAASPADAALEKGQLEAMAAWLHLQYRLSQLDEGQRAAQELIAETARLDPSMAATVEAQRYLSTAYLELGLIQMASPGGNGCGRVASQGGGGVGRSHAGCMRTDPALQEQLAHAERELVVTLLITAGSVPEAAEAARNAVAAVEGCADPSCRMRHAQALGTLGEIEWAALERRDEGRPALRRAVSEFEALSVEDPANLVFSNAAAQLRSYLALTLMGSEEAVALARQNMALVDGADAALTHGHERWMVHHIVFDAALNGVGRYADGESELRRVIDDSRAWNPNADLGWSAFHELAIAHAVTGDFAQALVDARQEWRQRKGPLRTS